MTDDLLFTRRFPAHGPVLLPRADGATPKSYHLLDTALWWRISAPDWRVQVQAGRGVLVNTPTAEDETSLAIQQEAASARLIRQWNSDRGKVFPAPDIAHAIAAPDIRISGHPTHWRAGLDHLRHDTAAISPPAGMPAAIDHFLRAQALRPRPADTDLSLRMGTDGRWDCLCHDLGDMAQLLRPVHTTTPDKAVLGRLLPLPAGAQAKAARFVAAARAVEMLALLVPVIPLVPKAYHPREIAVTVAHTGLGEAALRIALRWPADLADLSACVAAFTTLPADLSARAALSLPAALSAGRLVMTDLPRGPEIAAPPMSEHARPALAWQGPKAPPESALTYQGEAALSPRPLRRAGFALSPRALAVGEGPAAFADLSRGDQARYRAWLAGPRAAEGPDWDPAFGLLYLQGLEYRLLSGGAKPTERPILASAIRDLSRAAPERSGIAGTKARHLHDWLGVTHIRARGQPHHESPYTALTLLGAGVIDRPVLGAQALWALRFFFDDGGDFASVSGFKMRFATLYPDGLSLRLPQQALSLRYAPICGILPPQDHAPQSEGRPIPDLRRSAGLRQAWARLAAPQGGED